VETIALEYQYLLTAQLETQKVFFEELLEKLEKEKEERIQRLTQQSEVLSKEQKESSTKLKELEKEKKKAEKKSQELEKKLNEVSKESQFLKELNSALETNQKAWQDKIENIEKNLVHDKDQKIKELEEQVRDLMFYIEAQKKIEDSTSELKDGQLIVVPDASPKKTNNNNTTPARRTPRNRRK
jgi:BRCA1-associated protein